MLRFLPLLALSVLAAACAGSSDSADLVPETDSVAEISAPETLEEGLVYDTSAQGDLLPVDDVSAADLPPVDGSLPPDLPPADVQGPELAEDDAPTADKVAPDNEIPETVPEDALTPPETVVQKKGFGEVCAANEECESGICHEFGQGDPLCTIACATADDCPEGSQGKKCNRKGVCKP